MRNRDSVRQEVESSSVVRLLIEIEGTRNLVSSLKKTEQQLVDIANFHALVEQQIGRGREDAKKFAGSSTIPLDRFRFESPTKSFYFADNDDREKPTKQLILGLTSGIILFSIWTWILLQAFSRQESQESYTPPLASTVASAIPAATLTAPDVPASPVETLENPIEIQYAPGSYEVTPRATRSIYASAATSVVVAETRPGDIALVMSAPVDTPYGRRVKIRIFAGATVELYQEETNSDAWFIDGFISESLLAKSSELTDESVKHILEETPVTSLAALRAR